MNLLKLIESFDTDQRTAEEKEIYFSRKDAFKKLGSFAKKATFASLPVGLLTAMPKVAFAGTQAHDVLNFALTLEHLEYRFYQTAIERGVIPPIGGADDLAIFKAIRDDEKAHVDLLKAVIESLGEEPVEEPEFDFTAGGIFPDPFITGTENYQVFLALSQGFEDTGVRAYKGQAANIYGNYDLLAAALRIHSVEARHAAQVRTMRDRKGWITMEDYDGIEGFGAATRAIYQGEENTVQLGVDATTVTSVPDLAVEESWDETLTKDQVLNIAAAFIVS
jgi:rubrerythrin